jgi:hypothetical protein
MSGSTAARVSRDPCRRAGREWLSMEQSALLKNVSHFPLAPNPVLVEHAKE